MDKETVVQDIDVFKNIRIQTLFIIFVEKSVLHAKVARFKKSLV